MNDTYISVANSYVYPVYLHIPELKRNGLERLNDELNPYMLMKSLLADPKIETLFKSIDKKAFNHFFNHQEHLNLCWNSYKIAKRNGYKIKDYQLWCDMIKLLKRCGKDIHSTRYICPKYIKAELDRWNEKLCKLKEPNGIKGELSMKGSELKERLNGKSTGLKANSRPYGRLSAVNGVKPLKLKH